MAGPPPEYQRRIREAGAVVDMNLTQSLYAPLLGAQRRDGVAVTRDIAYGPDARHRLDVYQPDPGSSATHPVLLFLHGGGFIRGDKTEKQNIGLYFARCGFVVALANYRLAPGSIWPSGAEDVVAALEWLRLNVTRHAGDAGRIFIGGESAGASHVATATLMRRFHPREGLRIAGIVLISGVYDVELERLARKQFGVPTPDPRNDAYFGSNSDRNAEMSIVRNIDAAPVATLITYAELDPPQMQVQAGELFAALVTRHGFTPELCVVRGHNHLTQVYAINTGDESLAAPICDFLRRHC
jgi:acetyl esterase/lipase